MSSKRFIIADNQDITRYAISRIIKENFASESGEATVVASQKELSAELKRDANCVVVIDITNFDLLRTEDLVLLQSEYERTMWIIFASQMTEFTVKRLSAWPTFSFILKDCHMEEVVSALKLARMGERYICHQTMDILLAPQTKNQEMEQLTQTEIEVLRLTAQGRTVKEIAAIRCSSIHTITSHKRNIFRKINVNTSYEATMAAARMGLVDLMEYNI